MIAMERVAPVMVVYGCYVLPLIGFPYPDALWWRRTVRRGHPFEFSDIINQLQVVDVTFVTPSFVGLDVSASFPVKLVNKRKGITCPAMFGKPLTGDKLIPPGDENQLRINLKSAIPLFLEVPSIKVTLHSRVEPVANGIISSL